MSAPAFSVAEIQMVRTRLSSKFDRCVKSVRRTVRARNKESAAIAICTKSILHKQGRTLKKYKKGRLITQKKFRGGADVVAAKNIVAALEADLQEARKGNPTNDYTIPYVIDVSNVPNYRAGIEHLLSKLNSSMPSMLNLRSGLGNVFGTGDTKFEKDETKETLTELLQNNGTLQTTRPILSQNMTILRQVSL